MDLRDTSPTRLGHWSAYYRGGGELLERGREKGEGKGVRLGFIGRQGYSVQGRGAGRSDYSACFVGVVDRWLAIRGAPSAVRRKGKKQGRKGKKGKEGDDGRAAADRRGQHRSGEKESACGCALTSGTHGAVREKERRAASDQAGRALARASDARGRPSRAVRSSSWTAEQTTRSDTAGGPRLS